MSYTDSIEADHKNLAELLPENLDCPEQPQPTFALAGAYLISSPSAHPRSKEMHEVVTCVGCFVSYMSVVTAENPLHPHDLLTYVVNLTHRHTANTLAVLRGSIMIERFVRRLPRRA